MITSALGMTRYPNVRIMTVSMHSIDPTPYNSHVKAADRVSNSTGRDESTVGHSSRMCVL
jgi:hypothetical protein